MSKVTSKLQVTIPKAVADRYGIRPGSELEWVPAGEAIRVELAAREPRPAERKERLRLFDEATDRQRRRESATRYGPARRRGWKREDLYTRGRAR